MHLSANEPRKLVSRRQPLPWDWISGALLLLALYLAGGRLVATEWTHNLFTIQILGCIAVVFGMVLGRTRFPGWVAMILGAGYGLAFIPLQLSQLAPDAGDWLAQLSYVGTRMAISLGEFGNRENVSDPILFLGVMALVIWGLAVWAGYRLARHGDAWGATLPMGGLLVILQTYDNEVGTRSLYLAGYVLCILLLVSRQQLLRQQLNWERGRIQVPMYIGVDLLFAALGAGALIVLVAWATPALASPIGAAENAWSELTRPWRSLREDFSRAFYPLESAARDEGDYYGEALALGRGNTLSNIIQFTVQLLDEGQRVPRYYWRDRVYDHYENGEWLISFDQQQQMLADEGGLVVSQLEGVQQLGQFRFTTAKPINLLHTAPQPLDVNRNVLLTYATNPDGSLDLAALRTASQLQIGDSYEVASLLTATDEDALRASGSNYPAWVTERYLQVPQEITQRTRALAAQLAEGLDNNYDIAQAITRYLRSTIRYQDTVPSPPANSEPIDWVLFEEPRGFCNYYASAEVILLRILGIPARLAVGYAQGDRQSINLVGGEPGQDRLNERINEVVFYTVRQRDAHAWPEVYFAGIGWVEFEPTANQQELVRLENDVAPQDSPDVALEESLPAEEEIVNEANQSPEEQAARVIRETFQQQAVQGIILLGIVAILGFVMLSRRFAVRDSTIDRALQIEEANPLETSIRRSLLRRAHQEKFGPLERAYGQINSALTRLGAAPKAGHTPGERAAALATEVPELGAELTALVRIYQQKLYSPASDEDELPGWRLRIQLQIAVWRSLINKRIRQFRVWWHSLNPFTRPLL